MERTLIRSKYISQREPGALSEHNDTMHDPRDSLLDTKNNNQILTSSTKKNNNIDTV